LQDIRLEHEIEHGRYLAEHGAGEIWNWETPAGKKRWARRVKILTSRLRPECNVLELGCGTGYFTRQLAQTGARITAIDISADLLTLARQQCVANNVIFEIQNAYELTYGAATFDAIIGSSVLHHLDLGKALRELRRVLRPGGWIAFTEPNMLNPQIALQKNVGWLKRRLGDSPDETAFFRWSLRNRLTAAGFHDIEIVPFDFLHPKIPQSWIPIFERIGHLFEHAPIVREIAGSLNIHARG
jgi:2-polyprenyl-3-methyl-5-hydroxy-6-metoxy-1,4-benzoquinol methylase